MCAWQGVEFLYPLCMVHQSALDEATSMGNVSRFLSSSLGSQVPARFRNPSRLGSERISSECQR